jgi:PAS domain S-box-containing protein
MQPHEAGLKIHGLMTDDSDWATLASAMPVGIFRTDTEGRCFYINERVTGLTGLTAESAMQLGWHQFIHPDDREGVLRLTRAALQSGNAGQAEFRSIAPAGRIRRLLSHWTPERDGHGRVVGFVWTLTDTTHTQGALRASEERLAFLLKLSDALQPLSDPGEMTTAASRLLGEHLHVNRAIYADIEDDEFIIRHCYENGVSPFTGRGAVAAFGAGLLESYRRGEAVAVHDVRTDPRLTESERTSLQAVEIAAFAGVMLIKSGRWLGAFGVHSVRPRIWTQSDIDLIRDVAERNWEAVERARAETALREREWRLRLALDASGGGSWTWEASTNHVDWDAGFRALYSFAPDESPSHDTWLSRVHEEDRAQVLALLYEMLSSTRDAWDNTFRIVRPDGTLAWIQSRGRAERAADGRATRLTGLDLDVTERRRTEEAVQARRDEERDRELRLLLATATQGIVSVDAQGIIVTANHALEAMFGWDAGTLTGQSIDLLVPQAFRQPHMRHRGEYFARPRPRQMAANVELFGQRRDGSTFPIEVNLNHVATPGGGHAIAFVTDITARKRAEATLQERTRELERRTAQLSRMASDLTLAEQHAREQLARTLHDGLQQLLVSAAMSLDHLVKRDADRGSEELVQARSHIDEAIAAARSLSFELFPPVLHGLGLAAALTWLADWTRKQYGLVVQVSADPLANSDRKDVRILLFESVRELLFNAVKHAHVDRVALDLSLDADNTLHISVADRGVGFDPAKLVDRSTGGQVGWGLFSIRERLTLLGGRLTIDSAPGQGTRFQLIVPRGEERPAGAQGVTVFRSARALRILIADDHAGVRRVFRELLQEHAELQVVGEAANGLEAVAAARALRPDVVLMDVSMPGMDGIEATRRIRAELPFIEILGISTHQRGNDLHDIERAGAAGFFTKGVDTQRLLDHLIGVHSRTGADEPS